METAFVFKGGWWGWNRRVDSSPLTLLHTQASGPLSSGKAGPTEEGAPRGPRQAGDKQALDSRGGLRTLNPSPRLDLKGGQSGRAPLQGQASPPAAWLQPWGPLPLGIWAADMCQASDDRGHGACPDQQGTQVPPRALGAPRVCPEGQGTEKQDFRACLWGVQGVGQALGRLLHREKHTWMFSASLICKMQKTNRMYING